VRLKQQYFFCSATLQDILRRFRRIEKPLRELSDFAAIQLNDTHPAISVAELMRILVDVEGLPWTEAWYITTRVFSYTNHTILPEALETWPVPLFQALLPRHLQIVFDINQNFIEMLRARKAADGTTPLFSDAQVARMSIIEEGAPKRIRMANLAIIGSHKVNGVAAIHTDILKGQVFHDFVTLWPEKFLNITNGVTPRRWLRQCNPWLSNVITRALGDASWVTNLDRLARLKERITPELIEQFRMAKLNNKKIMRKRILKLFEGKLDVDPTAMFDVQVKRIHEYKRQLLNILGVIHRYLTILKTPVERRGEIVPKVVIFAGKAAAGYDIAKLIIKLINSVADTVNIDPAVGNLLKVVFIPNYSVSRAEHIIPASDLSQHISTAGTEASGTSNMKFAMNGGLILGTYDGANIEISQQVGEQNIFIFGARKPDVDQIRASQPCCIDERLYDVLRAIQENKFGYSEQFIPLIDPLWRGNDYYAVAHDFPLYLDALEQVDRIWRDPTEWTRRCIMSVASTGMFSSDRTIVEYATKIWGIKPCKLPSKEKTPKT
jgi:starch phosphorylase